MKNARVTAILTTSIATLLVAAPQLAADTVTVNNQSLLAHSIFDYAPTQGVNNWFYGYYNLTADPDGIYAPGDFTTFTEGGWTTFSISGPPPWTSISNGADGHPNGTNSAPGQEMWAIRRYVAQESANVDVNWFLAKVGGGDTAGEIFVNGSSLDSGNNFASNLARKATVSVVPGDVIDIALKPNGVDFSDTTRFGMALLRNNPQTYETGPLIADSTADFSGTQGDNNWLNGYYNLTLNGAPDAGGGDFIAFPSDYFNGTFWNWPAGDPPWTEIGNNFGHPNGTNNGDEHWATRRYVVQSGEGGDLLVDWTLAKTNPSGDGTTVRILVNGVLIDSAAVDGGDTAGVHRGVVIPNAQPGDVIDIALTPQGYQNFVGFGGDAANDGADGSAFTAKIWAVPEPGSALLLAAGAGLLCSRRRRDSSSEE